MHRYIVYLCISVYIVCMDSNSGKGKVGVSS